MKIGNIFLASALAAIFSIAANATDYYDITSSYLKNSNFDSNYHYPASATGNVKQEILEIDGWTKDIKVDYTITGVYQFGTAKTFNGVAVPATGQNGKAEGGCLALSTGWGESLLYYQDAVLPAGKYALVTAIYNCCDKTPGISKVGWLPTGKTASMSSINSFAGYTWIVDTIKFELTEATKGKIQIGYTAGSGGSANSAKIVVDYVKLLRDTPYGKADIDVFKIELESIINQAKELYGEGNGNGASELNEAIQVANAVIGNEEATKEIIQNAIEELKKAIDKYQWANPTGPVPTVKTDERFVRGATMAFARITATGTGITERGVCWSENPEPTVNDNRTTTYLVNNGNIYWLKDLKPATKYYMRAYAITNGRQVGYGETIKFYTIPMGNVGYTIRQDGDAATIQRITNAVQTAAYWWNNLTEIKHYHSSVGFVDGTPTADCSYGGWVRVGSNQSYQKAGTIMHEWLHGVGVIPWADTEWSRHNLRASVNGDGLGTGTWLGDRVTEVIRFWDNNTNGVLSGDYQHMWPYGINGAHEDDGSDILYIGNSLVCQALGEDGLQHTYKEFAQPYYALDQEDDVKYYIKSESADHGMYSSFLTIDKAGNLIWKAMTTNDALSNDSAAWYFSFTPDNQYYQVRNAATNRFITYTGNGTNGFKTAVRTTLTDNENLHIMRSRINVQSGTSTLNHRGYWLIHPTDNWTPPCLAPIANGATGTETFNIANTATAQRWMILTADDVSKFADAAVGGIKTEVQTALEHLKNLYAVPHIEDAEGLNKQTEDVISKAELLIKESTSSTELQNVLNEIRDITMYFLCNATPSDITKPFDLTSLMQNTGMDVNTGWTVSPSIDHSTGEFFQTTFDMNQVLTNMPAGTYQFCAQAFHRPGTYTNAYNDYLQGKNNVSAFIYAYTKSQKIMHIAEEARTSKLNKGNESAVGTPTKYIPNDRQSARAYFDQGLYENRIACSLDKDGSSFKVGIRAGNMPTSYWCCFDNFRLYFYGYIDIDAVTDIDGIVSEKTTTIRKGIYSLDGRLLSNDNADAVLLDKGIYIIDGKKVIISK